MLGQPRSARAGSIAFGSVEIERWFAVSYAVTVFVC
jgi:hypothetical protein